MSILDIAGTCTKVVEGIALAYGSFVASGMNQMCRLATSDGTHALVTSEGSMQSGFHYQGINSAVGAAEFMSVISRLVASLKPRLKVQGHSIKFYASRDKDRIKELLHETSNGSRKTLERLEINLSDVFESRETTMAKHCAVEDIYIALWTHPTVLASPVLKDAREKQKKAIQKGPAGILKGGAQDLFSAIPEVRDSHQAFVASFANALDLKKTGVVMRPLTAHEMLRAARMNLSPEFTPSNWKACLPGDRIPYSPRNMELPRDLGIADVQYPPIDWQMFPRDGEKIGTKYFQLGNRVYAPVYIEIMPQTIQPFSSLFESLNAVGVPWRTSFTMDGGGLSYVGMKAGVASFLTWASPYNKKLADSVGQMKANAIDNNVSYVRMKIAFCTWAPAGQMELLRTRVENMVKAITAWGDCEVREALGVAEAGVLSTVPFLSHESVANATAMPLQHAARMLPIMRQANPWIEGSVLYRTEDGKPMPFEPGSGLQDTWNYLFFAPPGSGKSVQMANMLLGAATQPGITKLPLIGIIDIGPSSSGLINLLRDELPFERRHEVAYIKLKNNVENAVNLFDTYLGCRYPTPEQKALLVNWLAQIATPAERKGAYTSTSELASTIIDNLYKKYSDESRTHPKVYSPKEEPEVDAVLRRLGIEPRDSQTISWWSIVDKLYAENYIYEATLAQRRCSPTLSDVAAAASEQSVKDMYSGVEVETREPLNEAFARLINAAIRVYPMLSRSTKFSLGTARVVALDIEEVAKAGSDADERMTGVMYLVARYLLTKNYRIDAKWANSEEVPPQYRDYWVKRAVENKENMKWIVYDEFHRTKASPAAQNSVTVDMREGRKWGLGVMLSSQSATDFTDEMKEYATGVFILKAPNMKIANELQEYFGLNETSKALMLRHCHGPTPSGAPMLAHLSLKTGTTDILLYSTLGPLELWALSTTAEDVSVRDRVTRTLLTEHPFDAPKVARAALAKLYPGGIKDVVAEMKHSASSSMSEEEAMEGAVGTIAARVVDWIREKSKSGPISREEAIAA